MTTFKVYVQHNRYDRFVDTGVIETNPEQQDNWHDICRHYGYHAFRFIPVTDTYHLIVPKRHARKRKERERANDHEYSARTTRNRQNRNVLENC